VPPSACLLVREYGPEIRGVNRELERKMREDMIDHTRQAAPVAFSGANESAASPSKSRVHSVVGTQSCRASRPFSGAVRSRMNPSLRTAPERPRRAAARRSSCRPCAESSLDRRAYAPAQEPIHGHNTHAGDFGVQTVAPRSIRPCAKSPRDAAAVSCSASASDARLGGGQFVLHRVEPRDHAFDIAVDRTGTPAERNRRDRGGGGRRRCRATCATPPRCREILPS